MSDDEAIEAVQDWAELEYWRRIHVFDRQLHDVNVASLRLQAKAAMEKKIAARNEAR